MTKKCACYKGSTCTVSHDPATCECYQCVLAEAKAARVAYAAHKTRGEQGYGHGGSHLK